MDKRSDFDISLAQGGLREKAFANILFKSTVEVKSNPTGFIYDELMRIAAWVRKGDYNLDDARDDIARAIENRAQDYKDLEPLAKSICTGTSTPPK